MSLWSGDQLCSDLQGFRLQAQAFGAELHDAVGAEGVADPELADGQQPERRVGLQLHRRDQDGLVARVDAAQAPEDEAQAAVGIQTDGHLPGGVELTLQLHRATEGSHGIMGHLEADGQGGGVRTEAALGTEAQRAGSPGRRPACPWWTR